MIVVDSSAVIAILYREPDAARLRAALANANGAAVSTGTLLELQLVVAGTRARSGWAQVEALLELYGVATRPFDERQLRLAREAALRYGKGRHKAALNFGDCFAYALAKSEDAPLLCTGNDFKQTDIELV
jgi:ribonuclease VapC